MTEQLYITFQLKGYLKKTVELERLNCQLGTISRSVVISGRVWSGRELDKSDQNVQISNYNIKSYRDAMHNRIN